MSDDEMRSREDHEFAVEVGYQAAEFMSGGGGGMLVQERVRTETALQVLTLIEARVADHLQIGAAPLARADRTWLTAELTVLLEVIQAYEQVGVPTLRGMENGFDLNPVINVFDAHTLRLFDLSDGDSKYSQDRAERNDDIELTDEGTARRSLFTLITDFLRFGAAAPRATSSAGFNFTVNTTKRGYVLDSLPEFGGTALGFGSTTTTPVSGLLTSGKYYFTGSKGIDVQKDGRLIPVGTAHTSTRLNW
jgi:hypothetical protein